MKVRIIDEIIGELPIKLIKVYRNDLTVRFTAVENQHLSEGTFPTRFKTAVVNPILKNSAVESANDLRPISKASIISQVREGIVFKWLLEDIGDQLDPRQYGFRSDHNIVQYLIRLIIDILDHLEKDGAYIDCIIADFVKAFACWTTQLLSARPLECDQTGKRIIAASHDVRRAFDSGVHAQTLSCAFKRGLDRSIVLPLRNLYNKLQVRTKVLTIDGPQISTVVVPVEKGIRQGAVSSPSLYNNNFLESRKDVEMSFVFKGRDISLLNYAYDILNLSHSFGMIEKNFDILRNAYSEINLSFNESKNEIFVFNRQSSDDVPYIRLGNSVVKPEPSLVYLGLPIGCDVKSRRSLLIEHLTSKIRRSYGLLIYIKTNYNRRIRARLFNALVQPHVIGLSPFWALLTDRNKRTIQSCFYRFCKFLLGPPPWTRNSWINERYGILDPYLAIQNRLSRYVRSLSKNNFLYGAMLP
ncbi:uncharacterized protein LOC136036651 [Artemia franciscana]|uniref:uncharacterized protein LOC136036651 n=1 Tax=Artemia franciscana TaxID=6661 RepID=UPI0032DBBCA3